MCEHNKQREQHNRNRNIYRQSCFLQLYTRIRVINPFYVDITDRVFYTMCHFVFPASSNSRVAWDTPSHTPPFWLYISRGLYTIPHMLAGNSQIASQFVNVNLIKWSIFYIFTRIFIVGGSLIIKIAFEKRQHILYYTPPPPHISS